MMAKLERSPQQARMEAVSRDALVQAALQEITQNYREASLSNVARAYGVSLAYVSECVRAQTGRTYKELLQKHRIGVTVIFPGYVESDMSRRYIGAKPWLCSAEHAARKIKAAIESGKREFAFPWILAFGIRLLNLLPHWAQGFFLEGFFFTVEPDSESKAQRISGKRGRDE